MTEELFCWFCDPPAPRKHEKTCRLYKEPEEDILDKFEDALQRAADRTGLDIDVSELMDTDVSEVMDKVRKANARSR